MLQNLRATISVRAPWHPLPHGISLSEIKERSTARHNAAGWGSCPVLADPTFAGGKARGCQPGPKALQATGLHSAMPRPALQVPSRAERTRK